MPFLLSFCVHLLTLGTCYSAITPLTIWSSYWSADLESGYGGCSISTIFQTSFFSGVFFRMLKHFQPTGATMCHSFSRFWVYPRVLLQLNIPRKLSVEHTQEELSPYVLWTNLILASFIHDLILLNELMIIDQGWNVGKFKLCPLV